MTALEGQPCSLSSGYETPEFLCAEISTETEIGAKVEGLVHTQSSGVCNVDAIFHAVNNTLQKT